MPTDDETRDYDDRPRGQRQKTSALPLVLILVAVGVVGCLSLGAVGLLFLGWGAARPVGGPGAVGPGGPVAVPGMGGPMAQNPANIVWKPYEDPELGFTAAFPNAEPTPFEPAARANIEEAEKNLDGVRLKGDKSKYLQADDAGRHYTLVVRPALVLGAPAKQRYLQRLSEDMPRMNKDYLIENAPPGEAGWNLYQDFTLRKGGQVKLVRILVADGLAATLSIEGDGSLRLADPVAKGYFERFASTKPAPTKGK